MDSGQTGDFCNQSLDPHLSPIKSVDREQEHYITDSLDLDLSPIKSVDKEQEHYIADSLDLDLSPVKSVDREQEHYLADSLDLDISPAKSVDREQEPYFVDSLEGSLLNITNVTVSTESKGKHECAICSKTYTRKYDLKRHMRIHEENYVGQCHICKKAFSSQDDYNMHKSSEHATYLCVNCGKSFNAKKNLLRHARCHEAKDSTKVLKCPQQGCHQTFTRKYLLESHMNIHSDNKQFKCSTCCHRFYSNAERRKHQLICTNKTKVTCQDCGIYFEHEKSLKRHVNAIHKNNAYYCGCGRHFRYKTNLRRHQKAAGHE